MSDINIYHLLYINLTLTIIATIIVLFYKFIFPKKNINLFVLLLLISIVPIWSIFRPGTYQAGDLHTHVAQLISFYNNLSQGIFIPRWAGELCGKFGCPIFEFYYLLPYYIGSIFHFVGFSILTSIKLVLALSFIFSGMTMYLWAKEEFGKIPGFVASVFYLFAPFHLIDVHFRGSAGEVLSFVFIPLVFLFAKRIIESVGKFSFVLETAMVILLLLSHSSTAIVVLPLVSIYSLILWLFNKKKNVYSIISFFLSVFFALFIASIYWLPALTEVKNSWFGLFTFGSFKPFWEYIFSPSRFGFLFQGNHGELRLIVGYFHLILVGLAIIYLFKNKFKGKIKYLLMFFVISFFALFYMMLKVSAPIWGKVSILNSFIMVWRLLVPIAFITSAISAIIVLKVKNIAVVSILVYLVIVSTLLNWGNRKMVPASPNPIALESENYTEYFEKNDQIYMQKVNKATLIKNSIYNTYTNYQPINFIKGSGLYMQVLRRNQEHEYIIKALSEVEVRENTLYFPGWKVFVDNKEVKFDFKNKDPESFNKITFKLPKGLYLVNVRYVDTPIRTIAKNITILSILGYLLYVTIVIRAKK